MSNSQSFFDYANVMKKFSGIEYHITYMSSTVLGYVSMKQKGVILALVSAIADTSADTSIYSRYSSEQSNFLFSRFVTKFFNFNLVLKNNYASLALSIAYIFSEEFFGKGIVERQQKDFLLSFPAIKEITGNKLSYSIPTYLAYKFLDSVSEKYALTDKYDLDFKAIVYTGFSTYIMRQYISKYAYIGAIPIYFLYKLNKDQLNLSDILAQRDTFYKQLFEEKDLINITSQSVSFECIDSVAYYFSYNLKIMDKLIANKVTGVDKEPFFSAALKYIAFLVQYGAFHLLIQEPVTSLFNLSTRHKMETFLTDTLYRGENLYKLTQDEILKSNFDNLFTNMIRTVDLGNNLANGYNSSFNRGVFGISKLMLDKSNGIILMTTLYNSALTALVSKINNHAELSFRNLLFEESKINTINKYTIENAKTLLLKEGNIFVKNQIQDNISNIRNLSWNKNLLSKVAQVIDDTSGYLSSIFKYWLVSHNPGADIFETLVNTEVMSKIGNWHRDNNKKIIEFQKALESINSFYYQIHKEYNTNKIYYSHESADEDYLLSFANIKLFFKNKLIIKSIEKISLNSQIVNISGPSGSGKSSLLSKIYGVKEDLISAEGQVQINAKYCDKACTSYMPQQDILPLYTNIINLVIFPQNIKDFDHQNKSIAEKRVLSLLSHLNFFNDATELTKSIDTLYKDSDLNSILSGGQKKKLTLASELYKQKLIVILDEPFNGLDNKSVAHAKDAIKKHLPDSLIMSIDHHFDSNQEFYDSRILLNEDNTLSYIKIDVNNVNYDDLNH